MVDAAVAAGVSERAAYTWLARYRDGGEPALHDRSSAPARSPTRGCRPRSSPTQHADDLPLTEPALPHRPSPDDGLSYINRGIPRGAGHVRPLGRDRRRRSDHLASGEPCGRAAPASSGAGRATSTVPHYAAGPLHPPAAQTGAALPRANYHRPGCLGPSASGGGAAGHRQGIPSCLGVRTKADHASHFLRGMATGRMGDPVAPRNLMQAPKKAYS